MSHADGWHHLKRVIARAWHDETHKQALLADPIEALRREGIVWRLRHDATGDHHGLVERVEHEVAEMAHRLGPVSRHYAHAVHEALAWVAHAAANPPMDFDAEALSWSVSSSIGPFMAMPLGDFDTLHAAQALETRYAAREEKTAPAKPGDEVDRSG